MDEEYQIESIRFALGLVGESAGLIDDTDILRYLDLYPSDWRLAGASLATALASRAINRPTSFTATGKMSISWGDRAKTWLSIAKSLREQVAADDKKAAELGSISSVRLRRTGYVLDDPEYARERKDLRLQRREF